MQIEDDGFVTVHPDIHAQLQNDEAWDQAVEVGRRRLLREGLAEIVVTTSLAQAQRIAADLAAQIDDQSRQETT